MMHYLGVRVRATLDASPAAIWAVISDIRRHPEIAGSGQVLQSELLTPEPIGVGARFQSQQSMGGLDYSTISHVVAYEPERHFAWQIGLPGTPPFAQVWQFELTPQGAGTDVAHSVALPYVVPRVLPFSLVAETVGQFEASMMQPTLRNIARVLGAPEPATVTTETVPPASAAAFLPPPWLQGGLWLLGGAALLRQLVGGRRA